MRRYFDGGPADRHSVQSRQPKPNIALKTFVGSRPVTETEFVAAVLVNPNVRAILSRLHTLTLDDSWLVSGALFQTIWNVKTGKPATHGIRDYDIFYFDADTSWSAENEVIERAAHLFADLNVSIEVRNQARVHLWYEEKFGLPYPPLKNACEGIDRFLMHNAQVGIRPRGAQFEIYAPKGLDDIERMIVRPNLTANFNADRYFEKASRWKSLWPGITILPP
jgi:uncharacterized protein